MQSSFRAGGWRQGAVALSLAATLAWPAVAAAAEGPDKSFAQTARDTAERAVTNVWSGAQDVAQFALGLIGVEYRWGGDSPERGLDCSGLIRYVFQEVTGVTLPRTARELSQIGTKVDLRDLRVGDLVFFNTRHLAFSHVGLYLGDNQFIHAPARGREVEITTISSNYWQKHFNGARRLVGVLPALVPSIIPEALAATIAAPAPIDEPVAPPEAAPPQ